MVPWWGGTILGALSLVILNNMSRVMPMGGLNWSILMIPLILCQLGFWYGFVNAPSFIVCWFIGSAITNILGVGASVLVFREVLTLCTVAGILCIMLGSYLLVR